jgi:hypothetical protein
MRRLLPLPRSARQLIAVCLLVLPPRQEEAAASGGFLKRLGFGIMVCCIPVAFDTPGRLDAEL